MRTFTWFALAGATGFAVDSGVLFLLMSAAGLGPFSARAFAIAAAMTCTWLINRRQTFGKSRHSTVGEGIRYGGVGLATSLVNYALYSLMLLVLPGFPPLAALVIASLLAMALSYMGYSRLVFRR